MIQHILETATDDTMYFGTATGDTMYLGHSMQVLKHYTTVLVNCELSCRTYEDRSLVWEGLVETESWLGYRKKQHLDSQEARQILNSIAKQQLEQV